MQSQTDMLEALGGTPVAMAYGDVYTSLQTGIIDGTENNETALTTGKHGEICKVFSMDQHAALIGEGSGIPVPISDRNCGNFHLLRCNKCTAVTDGSPGLNLFDKTYMTGQPERRLQINRTLIHFI